MRRATLEAAAFATVLWLLATGPSQTQERVVAVSAGEEMSREEMETMRREANGRVVARGEGYELWEVSPEYYSATAGMGAANARYVAPQLDRPIAFQRVSEVALPEEVRTAFRALEVERREAVYLTKLETPSAYAFDVLSNTLPHTEIPQQYGTLAIDLDTPVRLDRGDFRAFTEEQAVWTSEGPDGAAATLVVSDRGFGGYVATAQGTFQVRDLGRGYHAMVQIRQTLPDEPPNPYRVSAGGGGVRGRRTGPEADSPDGGEFDVLPVSDGGDAGDGQSGDGQSGDGQSGDGQSGNGQSGDGDDEATGSADRDAPQPGGGVDPSGEPLAFLFLYDDSLDALAARDEIFKSLADLDESLRTAAVATPIAAVGCSSFDTGSESSVVTLKERLEGDAAIQQLADAANADVIVLLTQGVDACGYAEMCPYGDYELPSGAIRPPLGVTPAVVLHIDCVGFYSFSHEVGHLAGGAHETADGDRAEPCLDFGNAFFIEQPVSGRTLLGSSTACGDCQRQRRFSDTAGGWGSDGERNAELLRRRIGKLVAMNPGSVVDPLWISDGSIAGRLECDL